VREIKFRCRSAAVGLNFVSNERTILTIYFRENRKSTVIICRWMFVLFVGCLSVIVVCWSTSVGCRVLTVSCRVSLSVVVFGSLLSGVGCRVLAVDLRCLLSLIVKLRCLLNLPSRLGCVVNCGYHLILRTYTVQ
jgi:hypothetical protein